MSTLAETLKQSIHSIAAIIILAAMIMPTILTSTVSAEELINRSIEMGTSAPSAPGVEYKISFGGGTSIITTETIVIAFCTTPLIGTTCVGPTSMNVTGATVVSATEGGDWTPTAISNNILELVSDDPADLYSSPMEIIVDGITNPSTLGTFYARIVTYDDDTGGSHDPEDIDDGIAHLDQGTVALHTAEVIDVTAQVNESMTFCVSGVAPGPSCTATSTPNLTLGDPIEGLQTDEVSEAPAYFQLSTNSVSSTVVKLRNGAASGGLNSGGSNIAPIDHASAAQLLDTGDAGFGVRLPATTAAEAGSDITGAGPYASNTASYFNMRFDEVTSAYGDAIASAAGPTSNANVTLTFGAQASNLTPAGVYTAAIVLIATSTY